MEGSSVNRGFGIYLNSTAGDYMRQVGNCGSSEAERFLRIPVSRISPTCRSYIDCTGSTVRRSVHVSSAFPNCTCCTWGQVHTGLDSAACQTFDKRRPSTPPVPGFPPSKTDISYRVRGHRARPSTPEGSSASSASPLPSRKPARTFSTTDNFSTPLIPISPFLFPLFPSQCSVP